VAIQERKRRSATKFAFPLNTEAEYAYEVAVMLWEARQRRTAEPEASKDSPQEVRASTTDIDQAERSPRVENGGTTIEFPRSGRFGVAVVGESRRQTTLRSLAGSRLKSGETVVFTAAIVPEPQNSFDPQALAVYVYRGGQVGYLSREDAAEYKDVTAALIAGKLVGLCSARLIGGTAAKPSIGVTLDLAEPATLLACIAPNESIF
jgi:hypothetical protein